MTALPKKYRSLLIGVLSLPFQLFATENFSTPDSAPLLWASYQYIANQELSPSTSHSLRSYRDFKPLKERVDGVIINHKKLKGDIQRMLLGVIERINELSIAGADNFAGLTVSLAEASDSIKSAATGFALEVETRTALSRQVQEIGIAVSELEENNQDVAQLAKTFRELSAEFTAIKKELRDLGPLSNQVDNLLKSVKILQKSDNRFTQITNGLTREVDKLDDEIKALKSSTGGIDRLKDQVGDLLKSVKILQKSDNRFTQVTNGLTRDVDKLDDEIKALKSSTGSIGQLNDQVGDLLKSVTVLQKNDKRFTQVANGLTRDVDKHDDEIKALKSSTGSIGQLNDQVGDLLKSVTVLQKSDKKFTQVTNGLIRDVDKHDDEIKALKASTGSIGQLNDQVGDLLKSVTVLQKSDKKFTQVTNGLIRDVDKLEKSVKALQKSIKEISALKKQLATTTKNYKQLQKLYKNLEKRIKKLERSSN